MGRLLVSKFCHRTGFARHIFSVVINCGMGIRVLYCKLVVFQHILFPTNSSLESTFRSDLSIIRENIFNANITLLFTGTGDREMCANKHAGCENIIVDPHGCANADPVGQVTGLLHLAHTDVKPAVLNGTTGCTLNTGHFHACSSCK